MDKILYPAQVSYLESVRNDTDELISEMEAFAKKNRIPILDWKSAELLESLITIQKPRRVLEIGTAIAYSSIRIGRRLSKKGKLSTIELSKNNIRLAKENIQKAGLEDKIDIVEGDALKLLPEFSKKFDFIFLDADKEDYLKLFELSAALLKKNGIIFIDNLLWHGFTAASTVPADYKKSTEIIREFNKTFLSHSRLNSTILPIGDGIGLGIKTGKARQSSDGKSKKNNV
jgi:predicted O-methyltransferase YrrM